MREAVIVSTARTPIGKAYRGAFNNTPAPTLAAHAIVAATERARVEGVEIDDCVFGAALPQGYQHTIGRTAAMRAGLPVTVPGMTMDRQCSSGLMAIATAAKQIIVDRMDIVLAGGVESISTVQTDALRIDMDADLLALHDDMFMPIAKTNRHQGEQQGTTLLVRTPSRSSAAALTSRKPPAPVSNHATPTGSNRRVPLSASSARQSSSDRSAERVYQSSSPCANRSSRVSPPDAERTVPGAYCSTSVTSRPAAARQLPGGRGAEDARADDDGGAHRPGVEPGQRRSPRRGTEPAGPSCASDKLSRSLDTPRA